VKLIEQHETGRAQAREKGHLLGPFANGICLVAAHVLASDGQRIAIIGAERPDELESPSR
jgi:hypothetical protein